MVNLFPGLVHTARHTMGVGHARSRYLNRRGGDAEGRASDWSEVVTRACISQGLLATERIRKDDELLPCGRSVKYKSTEHLVTSPSIISAPIFLSSSIISSKFSTTLQIITYHSPNCICIIEELDYPGLLKEADCATTKTLHFQRGLDMEYVDERQASESTCGCSTMVSKPHYKSFKFIENSREIRGLEGDKGTALELHRQKGEAVARNQPGVDAFMDWVNPVDGTEYPTSLSELEESRGRRKIYIKSNVMDSDMPEMVAFFQDSNYHFVKDIFMNGEVHCEDICSVENCQLDHNSISSILNFDVESSSVSTVGTLDSVPSISNESKYVADDDCHNLLINQHGSRMSMEDFDGQEYVLLEKNVDGSHMVKKVSDHFSTHFKHSITMDTRLNKRLKFGKPQFVYLFDHFWLMWMGSSMVQLYGFQENCIFRIVCSFLSIS
ncbi:hypothetical protein NC653_034650 [Populus alba x Populus x berolinensis]|uniref:Uncharacterized protein n=1 Tax=Populus alba x Populus x berolinensis TaxID=444605 RepID=A0AAD6LN19_9ROSI|nr:hypothetical protein NC653_034650 [Populus alba x Populus x berolinensis]